MTEEEKTTGIPPEEAEVSEETSAETSEETSEVADETVTEEASTEETGSSKKEAKKKKQEKKDPRDQKIEELNDRVLRQQAEFINYRNRTDKEKAQMFEVGAKSAFEKILPVIDNFERGLATLSDEEREQPFASGIDKTYRQLMTALSEAGVTPIEAVGQTFDPNLHLSLIHI